MTQCFKIEVTLSSEATDQFQWARKDMGEPALEIHPTNSVFSLSDAEYFKELGYYISEGIIEDKTMFLKRMTGLTRLYAAITITRLPGQDATSKDHPHGLGNLWRLVGKFEIYLKFVSLP